MCRGWGCWNRRREWWRGWRTPAGSFVTVGSSAVTSAVIVAAVVASVAFAAAFVASETFINHIGTITIQKTA